MDQGWEHAEAMMRIAHRYPIRRSFLHAFSFSFLSIALWKLHKQLTKDDGGPFIKSAVERMSTRDQQAKASLDAAMGSWSTWGARSSYVFALA